jgi:hypothetical protein
MLTTAANQITANQIVEWDDVSLPATITHRSSSCQPQQGVLIVARLFMQRAKGFQVAASLSITTKTL